MKHAPRVTDMPKAFDPKAIEADWYARWEKAGLFTASAKSDKPRYTICLPPPNVTGELHMGHALNGTVQDIWARYRRMTGHEVLFLPGTDHAAIATQNVIEKRLAKDGTSKEEMAATRSRSWSTSGTALSARPSSASTGCLALRWTGRASDSRWTSATSAQCSLH